MPGRGRGAALNPVNRFTGRAQALDSDALDADPELLDELSHPATEVLPDNSKTIIAYNQSPDIGFNASINPYRGCEHGCIYCYARPTHEYFGLSSGVDFETKIFAKHDAAKLLRAELMKPKWTPQWIAISGVTDAYQPVERRLKITRAVIEVLAEFRNPFGIVTKNHLITRDIDLLAPMAELNCASAALSITTLDTDLARTMEPRASSPARRLDAVRLLAEAGVPVTVMVSPIIPGLNAHEIPAILQAAKNAGAMKATFVMLRLPYAIKDLFAEWLRRTVPDRASKVLNRVREVRDGELYKSTYGERMKGTGVIADQIRALFEVTCSKLGLNAVTDGTSVTPRTLTTEHFRRPRGPQKRLFDD